MSFLRENFYMKYMLLPIVYLCSLGLFPLCLYWYTNLYVYSMFDQVSEASCEDKIDKVLEQKKLIEGEIAERRRRQQLIEGDTES